MEKNNTCTTYGLRKSKFGLVSAVIAASLSIGMMTQPIEVLAEETEKTEHYLSDMVEDNAKQDDSIEDSVDKEFSDQENLKQENADQYEAEYSDETEMAVASDEGAKAEEELTNTLDIDPVRPGDSKISGTTHPLSYITVMVDFDSKDSLSEPRADKDGKFVFELDKPLLYNQKVTVGSDRAEIFESLDEELEGGSVEKIIYTERHPEAAPVPQSPLEKDENGHHKVQVEPIFEGSKIIKGYTSVKGSLYVTIDSSIVSKAIPIEDGYFETSFLDTLDGQVFRKGDVVGLHFISEDEIPVIVHQEVREIGKEKVETPKGFTYNTLRSTGNKMEGVTEPMSQVQLFHAITGDFIDEAIADEDGKYSIDLEENLLSGQAYYRVFINPNNKYLGIVRQVVDKPEKDSIMSDSMISTILDKLDFFAGQELPKDQDLALQDIHDEKVHIVGRTRFANSILQITSSNQSKKYPPLQVDELGFWGLNLKDTELQFEMGEMITFTVVAPETFEVLATKTVPVRRLSDEDAPEEQPLKMPNITTDTGYIEGTVAPNLLLEVRLGGTREVIAEGHSDEFGNFSIDFGDRVFKKRDLIILLRN